MNRLKRRKPSVDVAGKRSGLKYALILLGLVAGWSFFNKKENPGVTVIPAPVKHQTRTVEIIPDNSPIESIPELSAKQLRAEAYSQSVFSIREMSKGTELGNSPLSLTIRPVKVWCRAGDLDTFSQLIQDEKKDEILISLESLQSNHKGETIRTSLSDLLLGGDKSMHIGPSRKSESIGLFICRDSARSNSCRDKDALRHDVLSRNLADPIKEGQFRERDFTLYFQNILSHERRLATYAVKDFSKAAKADLSMYLAQEYGLAQIDFDKAWHFHDVLRSPPLKMEGNRLILELPYNDPACRPRTTP